MTNLFPRRPTTTKNGGKLMSYPAPFHHRGYDYQRGYRKLNDHAEETKRTMVLTLRFWKKTRDYPYLGAIDIEDELFDRDDYIHSEAGRIIDALVVLEELKKYED